MMTTLVSARVPLRRHRPALLAVVTLLVVSSVVLGSQRDARAASLPRITGVEYVPAYSDLNAESPKKQSASCPLGKQVIGGGAGAYDEKGGIYARTVALTRLAPAAPPLDVARHRYHATAVEEGFGTTGPWRLIVWAVCADPVPGYELVTKSNLYSSSTVQTADPVCDAGKRALGSGAMINILDSAGAPDPTEKGVVLQVARADSQGGLTRTQAYEQPGGFASNWQLVGYALCANAPDGFEVITSASSDQGSENAKWTMVRCPSDKRLIGTGAAVGGPTSGTNAPGNVALQWMGWPQTFDQYNSFGAQATENTSTDASWTLIARGTCVRR